MNKHVWDNLKRWEALDPSHNTYLPIIVKEFKLFLWDEVNDETKVDIFLMGKDLGADELKRGMWHVLQKQTP
jgi:hypothetical protein